jgi:hypothetical protein
VSIPQDRAGRLLAIGTLVLGPDSFSALAAALLFWPARMAVALADLPGEGAVPAPPERYNLIMPTSAMPAPPRSTLYETDFYDWALRTAALLREGRFAELDVENIAEEIEGLARSDSRQIENRSVVLIAHLLKKRY